MRVCTACSRRTDESGRFCPECGAALVDVATSETVPAQDSMTSASRLLGQTLDGRFRIESIIGGGAFGTVYKGTQLGLDRPVAIKVPTSEIAADPIMAKRFAREAKSAARIVHPGVVAIHAVGELADGRPYLAMQFVDGQPLDKVLAEGPLAPVRALRLTRQIASALSETHAADVVHRDLKPTNIMWRRDRTGDDRITIVDFGIAVAKPGNAEATRLTADGLIGTPHYMSPEQAHGEIVDARADLYALGCLLFELVTGAPPFEGSGFEVLLAHLGRPAPLPSQKNPNVPETIDRICSALMQKKPEARPQHADEVVAMIDAALVELDGRSTNGAGATAAAKAAAAILARPLKRPRTVETRLDLPDGTEVPRHRRNRRTALVIVSSLVVGAAGAFAFFELRGKANTALADPAERTPGGEDTDSRVGMRRKLIKDNGEMIVEATVPDPLLSKQPFGARLQIKNKLGQPVVADEVVLTMADPAGSAKGLIAHPPRVTETRPAQPGVYYFRYEFPSPGRYVLRVFPPSVDSSFEIPIDVK